MSDAAGMPAAREIMKCALKTAHTEDNGVEKTAL
jgi:hypothetical protein